MNTEDSNREGDYMSCDSVGVYDNEVPLVGYIISANNTQLKIFSVKNEKTKHIFRFGSPVIKFQSNY
jgi:hypothetical protein